MNTKQTAFEFIKKTGRRKKGKEIVLETITNYPGLTRKQISLRSGMKESTVCGRVNDLLNEELIHEKGVDKSGVTACSKLFLGAPSVPRVTINYKKFYEFIKENYPKIWSYVQNKLK